MTEQQIAERIFCGVFPCGLGYADRKVERHGDYKLLAFISFRTLTLELEKDCPAWAKRYIEEDAARLIARRGQPYQISQCGQTVILGQ